VLEQTQVNVPFHVQNAKQTEAANAR
jgi:hypothetical protein